MNVGESESVECDVKENQNNLEQIIELCQKSYIDSDISYVFKCCYDGLNHWLVVMKMCDDTITNEARSDIYDPVYAKFRANKLMVVNIILIRDSVIDTPGEIISAPSIEHKTNYETKITKYACGSLVLPDKFDKDINAVCSHGIHYFRSVESAFYFRDRPEFYTGTWKSWFDDGELLEDSEYLNGIKIDNWTESEWIVVD